MKTKIIDKIKKTAIIASLTLAGTSSYSGLKFKEEVNTNNLIDNSLLKEYVTTISENYINNVEKSTSFEKAKKQYEEYKKSELEKILNEEKKERERLEKKKFLEPYYLTQDSLNKYIQLAQKKFKKMPGEFNKKLFVSMLKQESEYNLHAISKTGYIGLGQIGPEVYETFKPEKFAEFKNTNTGKFDTLSFQKELFNPVINLELSLRYIDYISKFCAKYDSTWAESDLDSKRKKMLFAYNAGVGKAREYNFDYTNKTLPKENREYPEKIMNAYYNRK